jgi:sec-independent protein translocase protein TatA
LVIGDILQPTHLLFVLVIALLVLGPKRLPEVGRALGRGLRDFRNAINSNELHDQMISPTGTESPAPVEQAPAQAPEAPVSPPADHPPATSDPTSSASSTDDSAPPAQEAVHSPEPTGAAPTAERVP